MDGKQAWAMRTWRWGRWLASFLTISWAVAWARVLVKGEQGWDLWWPLASTAT
ncbi:hypothetical protein SALBM135S_09802 [Streptomyces alboniger]